VYRVLWQLCAWIADDERMNNYGLTIKSMQLKTPTGCINANINNVVVYIR